MVPGWRWRPSAGAPPAAPSRTVRRRMPPGVPLSLSIMARDPFDGEMSAVDFDMTVGNRRTAGSRSAPDRAGGRSNEETVLGDGHDSAERACPSGPSRATAAGGLKECRGESEAIARPSRQAPKPAPALPPAPRSGHLDIQERAAQGYVTRCCRGDGRRPRRSIPCVVRPPGGVAGSTRTRRGHRSLGLIEWGAWELLGGSEQLNRYNGASVGALPRLVKASGQAAHRRRAGISLPVRSTAAPAGPQRHGRA